MGLGFTHLVLFRVDEVRSFPGPLFTLWVSGSRGGRQIVKGYPTRSRDVLGKVPIDVLL